MEVLITSIARAPNDWNFPSPTATPTQGPLGNNILQTPKTSSFPTHFQDAFTTPQMPGYSTPQQPHFPPMSNAQTSSDTLRSNYYAHIQAGGNGSAGQGIAYTPQVNQHGPLGSPTYGGMASAASQLPASGSFDAAQMRTPPPTRGTSTKKVQHHMQDIAFGTPSTIASRRLVTPQQSAMPMSSAWSGHQTPMHIPQLQFSPEMYQFASLGPMSAPVVPQTRILWDPLTSPVQPAQVSALDDPFAPVASSSWAASAPVQDGSRNVRFDATPAMSSFAVQAPHARSQQQRRMSDTFSIPSSHEIAPVVVDPSLLYSGPVRPILKSNSRSKQTPSETADTRLGSVQFADHSRTSSYTDAPSQASLQRSNTMSLPRPRSTLTSLDARDSLSRSASANHRPRTSSPVKRVGRSSQGSLSEGRQRQRASVILTVDENGIARTETKSIGRSTAMRDRYPALFDSDSSDGESNASDNVPSRQSSFVFDKRDERKAKAARLDPPVENLEGLDILRSSSAASMRKGVPPSRAVVAATAQLRRQSSLRRSTPSRNSRRNLTSSSTTSLIDTAPMDIPPEPQQSLAGAQRPDEPNSSLQSSALDWTAHNEPFQPYPIGAESVLDDHNRRWSMMSFDQQQRPPLTSPPQHYYHPTFTSPTMPPPQARPLQIRCQCGWPDDRGLPLVQCRSCTQCCHAPCVGLEGQGSPAAAMFTCFLCTRPPAVRVGAGR